MRDRFFVKGQNKLVLFDPSIEGIAPIRGGYPKRISQEKFAALVDSYLTHGWTEVA